MDKKEYRTKTAKSKKTGDVIEFQLPLIEVPSCSGVPVPPTPKVYHAGRIYQVPIEDLHPDPEQPRKYFDTKDLESLAQSLREQGVVVPIIFRVADDGKLMLVAGERRWRAASAAGLKKLPAILNSDGSPDLISLIENVSRCSLNPIELSEALERIKRDKSLIDADLTKIFGWGSSTLSEYRSLRKLPESVRDDCRMRSDVPMDVLVLIARKDDEKEMVKAYQDYLSGKTTRSSLKSSKASKKVSVIPSINAIAKKLGSIDVVALSNKDREKLGQSLDRLISQLSEVRAKIVDMGGE